MHGKMFKYSTAHVRQLDVEESLTRVGGDPGHLLGVLEGPRGSWGSPGGSWRVLGGALGEPWGGLGGSLGGPEGPWGGFLEVLGALGEDLEGPRRVVEVAEEGLGEARGGS